MLSAARQAPDRSDGSGTKRERELQLFQVRQAGLGATVPGEA